MCMYMCIGNIYIYIYIYREREREISSEVMHKLQTSQAPLCRPLL